MSQIIFFDPATWQVERGVAVVGNSGGKEVVLAYGRGEDDDADAWWLTVDGAKSPVYVTEGPECPSEISESVVNALEISLGLVELAPPATAEVAKIPPPVPPRLFVR